ncbi:unnamed protein product, partial [Meganyctiphanes norvegica]
ECLGDSHCGKNAFCAEKSSSGFRYCQCSKHYTGDPSTTCKKTCLSMEPCGRNSVCVEGNGNDDAVCSCLQGYHQDTDGSCHGCLKNSQCGSNAVCMPSISDGDKSCQCIENYSGDASVYCKKTCTAIAFCGKNQICEEGSDDTMDAVCKCLPRYYLETDGSCHECLSDSHCGKNAFCAKKTTSGFRKCQCSKHYTGDPSTSCKKTCLSMEPCGSNSECVEGNGNNDAVCSCLQGYHRDTDGSCHGCLKDSQCGSNAVCISSISGDKSCQCIENYSGDASVYCKKTCAAIEFCGENQICEEGSDDAMDAVCKCLPRYYLETDGSCHECLGDSHCGKNAFCAEKSFSGFRYCQCSKHYTGDPSTTCK